MTFAFGAGLMWLRPEPEIRTSEGAGKTSGYGALAAFCSALRCPEAIGEACLRALPASEASPDHLARLILVDLSISCGDCTSVVALRHSVKERSQDDFGRGRIVNVDGWMLSLTETRIYALSALLSNKHSAGLNRT